MTGIEYYRVNKNIVVTHVSTFEGVNSGGEELETLGILFIAE